MRKDIDPEFIQRMILLLANGIVLRIPSQTETAAQVLAHEFEVPWPVRD